MISTATGTEVSSIQEVPLRKIRESKTNPRHFFVEAKLAELADSTSHNGVRAMGAPFISTIHRSLLSPAGQIDHGTCLGPRRP